MQSSLSPNTEKNLKYYNRIRRERYFLPNIKTAIKSLGTSRKKYKGSDNNCPELVLSQAVIDSIGAHVNDADWTFQVVQAKYGSYVIRILEKGLETLYCKVAYDDETFLQFAVRENECYQFLRQHGVENLVEFVYADYVAENEYVILSKALKNKVFMCNNDFYEKLMKEIENFAEKTSKEILFNESDYYAQLQYIKQNISGFPDKELAESVMNYIDEYIAENDGKQVKYSYYYGDCRVENVAQYQGKLTWYDFQRGKFSYPPLMDKYHLIALYMFFEADLLLHTLPKFDWYDKKAFGEFMLDFFSRFISQHEERSQMHIEWFLDSFRKMWYTLVV